MTTRTEKFEFEGAGGDLLAGRLEWPADEPRAFALFAHCFTCGKDVFAATRIARGLAAEGFAVLRFDFTGLGGSEGDFANTDFSSNAADLVAAAAALRERHQAPRLLVGHSLGGAAALVAAPRIDEVRAVATIGAPSDPTHVEKLVGAALEAAPQGRPVEVALAGRSFRMQRGFLDDVRRHGRPDRLAELGRALLVMHSPIDEMVSIDHARALFEAARHPKSFVSLDDADHMLSRPGDSAYAARVLAAWSSRYVGDEEAVEFEPLPEHEVVVERLQGLHHRVRAGRHVFDADEPLSLGGTDRGPAPYDLVSAGLGACTAMTVEMYAGRKQWPLEGVAVHVIHQQRTDTGEDGKARRTDRFERRLRVTGPLDAEQRARLLEIANKCPVHRTLTENEVAVATQLVD
ncbi:Alpha/beta hydrolase family protein [Planctomycetes bacterium Pla163]|jgi:uncharacterized OsmC-like protein/pimeloyl-ACP methyl ester carboxylesterase|uniref:Alpha/beta hydrolase family protein n=1 Tax=Rohdeia mirabilis TaxID=2528008 RepID=A0A518D3G4_9BACT|nr:Alpha/beta hydrolase family protein [Planctomycetes bacterium Pla163]